MAAYSANLTLLTVLVAGEEIDGTELYGRLQSADRIDDRWRRYTSLWHGQFSSHEWNTLVDLIRVRIERDGEQARIRLRCEDGSPASLLDSIAAVHPPVSYDLTRFEIMLSDIEGISYAVQAPPMSPAGRIIREAAFLPNWRAGMLLLQSAPFLRATGPAVRWYIEDDPFLPGALLAELDYTRDADPVQRAAMYRRCSTVMAGFPELREQLLLRLSEDIHVLTPSTTVELLYALSSGPPTRAYLDAIDRLWQRTAVDGSRNELNTRHMVIALTKAAHKSSPDADLNRLSRDLLIAVRTGAERSNA